MMRLMEQGASPLGWPTWCHHRHGVGGVVVRMGQMRLPLPCRSGDEETHGLGGMTMGMGEMG